MTPRHPTVTRGRPTMTGYRRTGPRGLAHPVLWIALAAGLAAWSAVTTFPELVGTGWGRSFEDLLIYRDAALAARHGQDVYGLRFSFAALPFTYPPFALLVLGWTTLLSERATQVVMLAANTALVPVVCVLATRTAAAGRWVRSSTVAAAAVLTAVATGLEPVRQTVGYGQINLLVLLLVLVDGLLVPARWRGVLTGAATSLKLTPGVFVLYFAVTGQWRAAGRQVAATVATSLLAAALLPRSSVTYWTSRVFTNRAGPTVYVGNQSWTGLTDRLVHARGPAVAVILALDLLTVAVAAVAVRGCVRRGAPLSAVCAVGLTGLLLSPISWPHHWVWVVPTIAALAIERPFRGAVPAAAGLAVVSHLRPGWQVPVGRPAELHWTWWQTVLGNPYPLAAAVVLVALAGAARSVRRDGTDPGGPVTGRSEPAAAAPQDPSREPVAG